MEISALPHKHHVRYKNLPVLDVVNNATKLFDSHKKLSHSSRLHVRVITISMLIERSIFVWPTLCVVSLRQCRKLIFIFIFLFFVFRECGGRLEGIASRNVPLNNEHRVLYMCDVPIVWHYTTLQCIYYENAVQFFKRCDREKTPNIVTK